jgi:hypothetical protein
MSTPVIVKHVTHGDKTVPVYENRSSMPYLHRYKMLVVTPYGSAWQHTNMFAPEQNPMHKKNIAALHKLFKISGLDFRKVKLIRPE